MFQTFGGGVPSHLSAKGWVVQKSWSRIGERSGHHTPHRCAVSSIHWGVDHLVTQPFPKTARYGCRGGVGLSPVGSLFLRPGQRIVLDLPLGHSFIIQKEASLSEQSSGKACIDHYSVQDAFKAKRTDYLNP